MSNQKKDPDNDKKEKSTYSITTEGCDATMFDMLPENLRNSLITCGTCYKFYCPEMIFTLEESEKMCKHCFFWLNYDVSLRKEAEGKDGVSIAKYVLECCNDHDLSKCSRMGPYGGCFLCEYKLGIPILHIKDAKLLEKKEGDKPETENITDEIEDKGKTVDLDECFPETIHI